MLEEKIEGSEDLEVEKVADYLDKKRITVCITSGIAAMEAPKVIRQLRRYGADISVIMSEKAKEYFGTTMFEWASGKDVITKLSGKAEHIRNDDAALVLPATLNTIGEIVNGEAHSAVTTYLASAIGRKIPITIVPAMHLSMYNNPLFQKNLKELSKLENIVIVEPRFSEGKAKVAGKREIVAKVTRSVSDGPLKGKSVLITAGPTRGYLDPVRFITNMSSGRLGLDIANDLYLRGADVKVVFGPGKAIPAPYLDIINVRTADEMLEACLFELGSKDYDIAIFSAAVSDYVPEKMTESKIRSGKKLTVSFKPTKKIIKEVDKIKRSDGKKVFKVGFKLETADSDEELIAAAHKSLLENKCHLVVANNLKEIGEDHRAFLITPERGYIELKSKNEIVFSLAHELGKRVNSIFYKTIFSNKKYNLSDLINPMRETGKELFDLGVIPKYQDRTYGNFSIKTKEGFVITGRGVNKGDIKIEDLVMVEKVNHEKREMHVSGKVKGSTETVCHWIIYDEFPDIKAIIHAHDDLSLKNAEKLNITTTEQDYPCGTYELGKEIISALKKSKEGYIALRNHGVLAVGDNLKDALSKIESYRKKAELIRK